MSISIKTSNNDLASLVDKAEEILQGEQVSVITPAEFAGIRRTADDEVAKVTLEGLRAALGDFQLKADGVVNALQVLNVVARKNKLGIHKARFASEDSSSLQANDEQEATVIALKQAIEYQLAYIVLGYKATLEKL